MEVGDLVSYENHLAIVVEQTVDWYYRVYFFKTGNSAIRWKGQLKPITGKDLIKNKGGDK